MARGEIREFLGEDQRIAHRWTELLGAAEASGASFDELAGRIESEVAEAYQQSFDELSIIQLSPEAPSAPTLESLRRYAETRRDVSRALVDGLRAHDIQRVREALEQARRPPPVTAPGAPSTQRGQKAP